jgi:hypothetical protein
MMEFTFGEPKPRQDFETNLFNLCLLAARNGQETTFKMKVVENISVPFIGKEPNRMEVASFPLAFEARIPVIPVAERKSIQHVTFPQGDLAQEEWDSVAVWHTDSFYAEVGRKRPADMKLPEYLRAMAHEWATALVKREMAELFEKGTKRGAWEIEQLVDMKAITASIEAEFEALSVAVDDCDDFVLGRRTQVPSLRLVPDPIMGVSHHLGLAYAEKTTATWQDQLTSFPIADYASASKIRSELVRRHCEKHDPEFGYDWTDATLRDRQGVMDSDEQLLAQFPVASIRFDRVLNDFGQRFAAVFSNVGGEWRPIQEALATGDLDRSLEAIREISEARPSEYKNFLEGSGWTLPIDPLEIFELRLRQKRGMVIGPEPVPAANGQGPRP